jgi:hypothetical protein
MALPRSPYYSVDEYLAMERESATRHEYIDGHIYDMAGQWLYSSVDELSGRVEIASIGCRLDLVEIYSRADFPEVPPSSPDER